MRQKLVSLNERYIHQVRLLLSVLVDLAEEDVFALKGGTAINLFYRDMPRLSVDIDLAYLPVEDHRTSLMNIDQALERTVTAITTRNSRIQAHRIAGGGNHDTRIMVNDGQAQIKLETSPVIRGAVHPPRIMNTSDTATEMFGFTEMNILSFGDLYGGKLCAALDRQHPRDLFDIKLLYENEGLTHDLFSTFLVYVASSSRPMHELLAPNTRFDEEQYNNEFDGMTREAVTRDGLIEVQKQLHTDIRDRLSGEIAAFLLSLHDADPDFSLIGLAHAADLPAVRWKLTNLEELKVNNPKKHVMQRRALEDLFV